MPKPLFFRSTGVMIGLAVLIAMAGCNRETVPRVGVKGQVLIEGKPLPQGAIVFVPTGKTQGPRAAGEIRNGSYTIPVAEGPGVGTLRVQVWGNQESQVPDVKQTGTSVVTTVPAQFNEQSTLSVETKLDSENRFDFDLKNSKSTKSIHR